MRAVANMPGFNARSWFANFASTVTVREFGSTVGLMDVTLPWNVRPG